MKHTRTRWGKARVEILLEKGTMDHLKWTVDFASDSPESIPVSLLKEIQDAAVDGSSDLETLLRKCRVLAAKLRHEQFQNWVKSELDGYNAGVELPKYRNFDCQCFGHFVGPMGSGIKDAPIGESSIEPRVRDMLTHVQMRQGVSELKDLIDHNKDGQIRNHWPADACRLVSGQYADHLALAQAWTMLPRANVVGVLSTVRNRILDFALEIEASNPNAGEAEPGTTPIPKETVTQIFYTHIYGNVGNVASGHEISQTATMNVEQGDFGSLSHFLKSRGVEQADVDELETALKSEPPTPQKGFGGKVSSWIGKMTGKAASGVWKVALDTAPGLLSDAIKKHCGL
jgi:hypothetical protein